MTRLADDQSHGVSPFLATLAVFALIALLVVRPGNSDG